MEPPLSEHSFDDLFAEEKRELAEIDFSSLLDFAFATQPAQTPNNFQQQKTEKYVVFLLDEKLYGISSESVLEIISAIPVTPLPNVENWLAGIANLRGTIISVVDLRKLWGKPAYRAAKPRMIVLNPVKNDAPMALLVDKVGEVALISNGEIDCSANDFQNSFPTFFGKAEHNGVTLSLIDTNQLFASLTAKNAHVF